MLLHFLSQETFQNSHESGSVDKACKKSTWLDCLLIYTSVLWCIVLVMPDIQNFFHKVLAVIFTKVYFRRKLSASFIEWYIFPVAHSTYAEVTLI